MLWLPVVKAAQGGQLVAYIVVVEGLVAAPLPILFMFAVFWNRCTEKVRVGSNYLSCLSNALFNGFNCL